MTGLHVGKHSSGTRTCRACRPVDPCRWKGANNAAKDPAGDDTAPATTMSGAASTAQERAIIVKVWDKEQKGGKWARLLYNNVRVETVVASFCRVGNNLRSGKWEIYQSVISFGS
jgi:hypothetical protein